MHNAALSLLARKTLFYRLDKPIMLIADPEFTTLQSTKNPGLVKIYNIKGQLVRRLHDESGGYGPRKISWDSKDSNGNSVASGLYFFRIESGDRVSTRKAILLK
ncbi:MAG: T9SS type A sorting domain-containing protein [Candidatus Cloacimonetes bacterium]|nr:T9SS type A sorting domain-containing protein [Candidatus Cloacimonadota bacterium]